MQFTAWASDFNNRIEQNDTGPSTLCFVAMAVAPPQELLLDNRTKPSARRDHQEVEAGSPTAHVTTPWPNYWSNGPWTPLSQHCVIDQRPPLLQLRNLFHLEPTLSNSRSLSNMCLLTPKHLKNKISHFFVPGSSWLEMGPSQQFTAFFSPVAACNKLCSKFRARTHVWFLIAQMQPLNYQYKFCCQKSSLKTFRKTSHRFKLNPIKSNIFCSKIKVKKPMFFPKKTIKNYGGVMEFYG